MPVGGASKSAFIIVNQLSKTDSGATATEGSPVYVYEVRLDSTTGTLVDEEINRVEITLPIDLSQVSPGDLESGRVLIYKAATQTDLLDPASVPPCRPRTSSPPITSATGRSAR